MDFIFMCKKENKNPWMYATGHWQLLNKLCGIGIGCQERALKLHQCFRAWIEEIA